ncbi:beta-glucan synthesis-associated [Ephemerocybe angulata]|uniref:Beta-glucan synthesis-associated n=1 Tax=Ephemerocybe angulata TaxID=980116 RepID=A0A8H6MDP5_9AGAR|nr:beta-glucan synthesis-associated [Tulosesus angulatus]
MPAPPKLNQRDSDLWSEYSSFDSTPRYPSGTRSSLATISAGKILFSFDARDFPFLTADYPDSEDEEEKPGLKKKKRPKKPIVGCNPLSPRGCGNVLSLFLTIGGLVSLFVLYPVISFLNRTAASTLGGYNIGGINASGQIPEIRGNYGLIDLDTPKDAYTMRSWRDPSVRMNLVFSDEFNEEGRSFYPGDDPYWEAVDLHYWATGNLEWYDPKAVTTQGGALVVTLSQKATHGLNYEGGMITSWNKFCFTGGYIEASVMMPGVNNILGLWPAVWTMGNLGRAGYGATLEGVWPYTYDSCDVGTAPNQTINGLPLAAAQTDGGGPLSYLPGQKLSRCTCNGEDHPGPKHPDGTFVGRAAPEIDIFEAQIDARTLVGEVSQSAQWAPFNADYHWNDTPDNLIISNTITSKQNTYIGGLTQQATSVVTQTDQNCYERGTGCFSVYGFEYKPGFDNAYISWISNDAVAWTMLSGGLGPDADVQISARPVSQEPMYIIVNLGMSRSFGTVDLAHIPFPVHMRLDYIRVYQPSNAINVGCNPKNFPTTKYIRDHIQAYTNPNLTTWVDDYRKPWPKNSLIDQC